MRGMAVKAQAISGPTVQERAPSSFRAFFDFLTRQSRNQGFLRSVCYLLFTWAFALAVGCSEGAGSRVPTPSLSSTGAAKEALAEYDTNRDGYLDAKELEQCPSLKKALKSMDTDKDGRLSGSEIAERLTLHQESGVGLISATCQVRLDGRPLPGATVTFVPEKFLGTAIKPASGVSDASGFVLLQAEEAAGPGVQPGFYRVQVSKKNAKGEETIPAKYNTKTILGEEVSPVMRNKRAIEPDGDDDMIFRLTSR